MERLFALIFTNLFLLIKKENSNDEFVCCWLKLVDFYGNLDLTEKLFHSR